MGARQSTNIQTVNIPLKSYDNDFMFHEGCMALSRQDYTNGVITSAPCLVVPVSARTLPDVVKWAKLCVATLGQRKFTEFQQTYQEYVQTEQVIYNPTNTAANSASQQTSPIPPPTTSTVPEPRRDPYDAEKHYKERLRELLRVLNIVEKDDMYVTIFSQQSTSPSNSNSSVQGTKSWGLDADGLNVVMNESLPQLPGLPQAQQLLGGGSASSLYKFLGPAYLLIANNMEGDEYIEGYLYFPTMTKDALPAPNYDFIGKSHRWLYRLLNDTIYSTKGDRCEKICYGTSAVSAKPRYGGSYPAYTIYYDTTIVPCGCRSTQQDDACGNLEERDIKNKDGKVVSKLPSFVNSFVVYRINHEHPDCKTHFAADSPIKLLLNIMPSEWDVYPGCKYIIVSNNNKFFIKVDINGTFGVFLNGGDDLLSLCKSNANPTRSVPIWQVGAQGMAERLVVEDTALTLYHNDGQDGEMVAWKQEVADPNAAAPLALVILDDGRLDVFDRNNRSVVTPTFRTYVEDKWRSFEQNNPENVQSSSDVSHMVSSYQAMYYASENDTRYDPNMEYARRLLHLKEWLRARNLLFETVGQYIDLSSMTARMLMKGDSTKFEYYDPSENYRTRYAELLMFMKQHGI